MNNRYARQTTLSEIGEVGQQKIANASVLCIGAGGLGCPALLYLAAAGVGRIGIVDFDHVETTNLQRQVLFTSDQIGQNKAEAARDQLQALNPEIEITPYPYELNADNAEQLFAAYDLIIDGSDNFATKFLVNDAAVKTGKPFIYGSILGFDGQVSVFNFNGGPCYRCLFPEPPQSHIPNCAEAGVIGAVAGLIGTTQAMEAIKIIVQDKNFEILSGQLWIIDTRSMQNRLLSLPVDQNCPVCSKKKEDIILQYTSRTCSSIPEITVEEAQKDKMSLFIDVREDDEWHAGHIEGAEHFALSALMMGKLPDIAKDREIILYCQKGIRSQQALQIMKEQGYTKLQSMAGGYAAWGIQG